MANRFDITESKLRELYLDRGYSIRESAEYYGCSTSLIEIKLSKYDIDTRPPGSSPVEATPGRLKVLYIGQDLTTIEIADRLDCHPSTVGKKLNQFGIPTTGPNHGRSIQVDEDRLRRLYLKEGETTYQIAERFDCDPTVIERRLRWYGIEDRHTDAGETPGPTNTAPAGGDSVGRRSSGRTISANAAGSPTISIARSTSSRHAASGSVWTSIIGSASGFSNVGTCLSRTRTASRTSRSSVNRVIGRSEIVSGRSMLSRSSATRNRPPMPTYVHLITITAEGLERIADGLEPNPAETAARFGGEILADYLTLGAYDIVSVTSFPDDDAAASFALAMAGEGHTRTETMRAFDVEAFRDIVASLDAT